MASAAAPAASRRAPHPARARRTRAVLRRRVVLGGDRLLHLPDRHRGVQPAVEHRGARGARRLPAARHLRAAPALSEERPGLADRRGGLRRRAVPLGLRGRAGAARRRHDRRRHGGRHPHHRAGVRGGAAHHGFRAAADLPDVPGLRPVRPVPARRAGAPWLRAGPDRRPARLRHRGYLRHADLRVVELHLPVHPVRRLPRAGRHDHAVHRLRARPVRPHQGRPGQGGGGVVGADGHDQRLGRGQRGHHGSVHDPADEALRLQAGLRRRRRGHVEHGRADHAAGDGRGGLHHGRDHRRALCRDLQGRGHPGDAVFPHRLPDGAPGSRARRAGGHPEGRMPRPLGRDQAALVPDPAAGGAGLVAVFGLHAAVLGHGRAGADGHPDLRRGADPTLRQPRAADDLLGADRPGGVELLRLRHRRDHRPGAGAWPWCCGSPRAGARRCAWR